MKNKNETVSKDNQPLASEIIADQREQFRSLTRITFCALILQALVIAGLLIINTLHAQANERKN